MAWLPSELTLVRAHAASGRSSNEAGTDGGSSAHRVCATASSKSDAVIDTPTEVLYQPFEPFGVAGVSAIVVTGGSGAGASYSYAPMSAAMPCGRRTPRWSSRGIPSPTVPTATLIAGLV